MSCYYSSDCVFWLFDGCKVLRSSSSPLLLHSSFGFLQRPTSRSGSDRSNLNKLSAWVSIVCSFDLVPQVLFRFVFHVAGNKMIHSCDPVINYQFIALGKVLLSNNIQITEFKFGKLYSGWVCYMK